MCLSLRGSTSVSRPAEEIWKESPLQALQGVCGQHGQQWPHLQREQTALSVQHGQNPCGRFLEEVLLQKQQGVWDQRNHPGPHLWHGHKHLSRLISALRPPRLSRILVVHQGNNIPYNEQVQCLRPTPCQGNKQVIKPRKLSGYCSAHLGLSFGAMQGRPARTVQFRGLITHTCLTPSSLTHPPEARTSRACKAQLGERHDKCQAVCAACVRQAECQALTSTWASASKSCRTASIRCSTRGRRVGQGYLQVHWGMLNKNKMQRIAQYSSRTLSGPTPLA